MRVVVVNVLVLAVLACRDEPQAGPGTAPRGCDDAASAPAPASGWWRAEPPCPSGARLDMKTRIDKTEIACVDSTGELEGPWALLDAQGRIESIGTHRDDLRHGEFVWYTDGVRTQALPYCAGVPHGSLFRWTSTSASPVQQGTLLDGEQHGAWRTWHDNGQLARLEHYRHGLHHGVFAQWDDQGRLLGLFVLVDGNGPWRHWADNGVVLTEGQLRRGKPVGRWIARTQFGDVLEETDHGN